MAKKFISHSLKERNLKDFEGERTIEVSEDVLNQLHSAHYFLKKKGKTLLMLSASKELGAIKRKRKRLIREFGPYDKEEKKEPSSKRQKKNDEANQRITEWLIKKMQKKIRRKTKWNKIEMNNKIVKQIQWTLIWIL